MSGFCSSEKHMPAFTAALVVLPVGFKDSLDTKLVLGDKNHVRPVLRRCFNWLPSHPTSLLAQQPSSAIILSSKSLQFSIFIRELSPMGSVAYLREPNPSWSRPSALDRHSSRRVITTPTLVLLSRVRDRRYLRRARLRLLSMQWCQSVCRQSRSPAL